MFFTSATPLFARPVSNVNPATLVPSRYNLNQRKYSFKAPGLRFISIPSYHFMIFRRLANKTLDPASALGWTAYRESLVDPWIPLRPGPSYSTFFFWHSDEGNTSFRSTMRTAKFPIIGEQKSRRAPDHFPPYLRVALQFFFVMILVSILALP